MSSADQAEEPSERAIAHRFRPEIQGLRAVAVLSVVLFHAKIPGFSGGYAGVDIFFVISGYLISRNILDELKAGTFTFSEFYARRIRRIIPALLATLVATLIVGALWLTPAGLEQLAQQALASLGFVSNFYFWLASHAYFTPDSDHLPLLHLWSLSVEEQVYLLWPLMLIVLWRLHVTFAAILVISVLSLIAAHTYLSTDSTAAFYLTPFRVYQFGLGAMVLFVERARPAGHTIAQIALAVGLVLCILGLMVYGDSMRLAPVSASVGAALIIYAGNAGPLARLLTNKLAVGIGEMSYSIYLAHWPVIVFAGYILGAPPDPIVVAGSLVATVALGAGMYRFVERPFRRSWTVQLGGVSANSIALLVGSALLIGAVTLTAIADRGWSWRLTEGQQEANRLEGPGSGPCEIRRAACSFGASEGEPGLLLVGDSYVEHYIAGLDGIAKRLNVKADAYVSGSCLILDGLWRVGYEDARCLADRDRILTALQPGNASIIIAQAWHGYPIGSIAENNGRPLELKSEAERLDVLRQGLERTIARLGPEQHRFMLIGQQVLAVHCKFDAYRFGFAPLWHMPSPYCPPLAATEAKTKVAEVDAMLDAVAAKFPGRVTVLKPVDHMCDAECEFVHDGIARYRDAGHLSVAGSEHFAAGAEREILAFLKGE